MHCLAHSVREVRVCLHATGFVADGELDDRADLLRHAIGQLDGLQQQREQCMRGERQGGLGRDPIFSARKLAHEISIEVARLAGGVGRAFEVRGADARTVEGHNVAIAVLALVLGREAVHAGVVSRELIREAGGELRVERRDRGRRTRASAAGALGHCALADGVAVIEHIERLGDEAARVAVVQPGRRVAEGRAEGLAGAHGGPGVVVCVFGGRGGRVGAGGRGAGHRVGAVGPASGGYSGAAQGRVCAAGSDPDGGQRVLVERERELLERAHKPRPSHALPHRQQRPGQRELVAGQGQWQTQSRRRESGYLLVLRHP